MMTKVFPPYKDLFPAQLLLLCLLFIVETANGCVCRAYAVNTTRYYEANRGMGVEDSTQTFWNKDVMVLGKYGGNKRKLVKKGTLLKVYSIPVLVDEHFFEKKDLLRPKKQVFRGYFDSVVGDTLIIVQRGKILKFDIDDLFQIKVYNEIGARVFGDMVNLVGIYGMAAGGYVAGFGAIWSIQGNAVDGLGLLVVGFGAMVGGLGYLVHRLALILKRNKYDLIDDWYIVRGIE